jgi:hypothetical protein
MLVIITGEHVAVCDPESQSGYAFPKWNVLPRYSPWHSVRSMDLQKLSRIDLFPVAGLGLYVFSGDASAGRRQ